MVRRGCIYCGKKATRTAKVTRFVKVRGKWQRLELEVAVCAAHTEPQE